MSESILISIKKLLGIAAEYDNFDQDIIMHINSVFLILRQLGVGPEDGYRIEGETNTWTEFIEDAMYLDTVKSYIYLKVKQLFDPPTNPTVTEANKQLMNELEWRINADAESKQ